MGNLSGIIAGLVGSGQGENNYDLSALYSTIQNAGQYQQQIINALPAQIQQNLATYAQSQGAAGQKFAQQIQGQGANYLQSVNGLYGPNSAAAQAQKAANTQNIYSTVPGTSMAVRNALAATGGLQRGQAGTALAQVPLAAAAQAGQANANVNAQQTQAGQQATQQALATVNSMDAGMFQQLFGMSQQQAATILQTGNQALQNQLAQLINQSQTQTNQTLGLQGVQAQQGLANADQQQGYQNAIWNGLGNLGVQGLTSYFGGGATGLASGLGDSGTLPNPTSASMGSTGYQPPNLNVSGLPGQYATAW
jgi:hypothetical protein